MDLKQLVERLRSTVESARSMPMSSSVVLNRSDVLSQLEELESALPVSFAESERVLSERDTVVSDARQQADAIIEEAILERDRLVSESEVVRGGRQQVDDLRRAAERDCEALRQEADEYVDGRLANLEISLTKTLEAVNRGRERLQGRSALGRIADPAGPDDRHGLDDLEDKEGFTFPQ